MSGHESVVAVVVTYNPDDQLADRLLRVKNQVSRLYVIDNGSKNVQQVESAACLARCDLVLNEHNAGIATALNQAVILAETNGAKWLATFDQDSVVPPHAIPQLLRLESRLNRPQAIAMICMSHRDTKLKRDYHRPGDIVEDGEEHRLVKTSITSGSVIKLSTFRKVGLFDESLFIDMVDLDFCIRCRKKELAIVESKSVVLDHTLGDASVVTVLSRKYHVTNHSSVRRYYITRNQIELCRRHFFFDLNWTLGLIRNLFDVTMGAILFERDKGAKLLAILAGARDFVLRRFGPKRPMFSFGKSTLTRQ